MILCGEYEHDDCNSHLTGYRSSQHLITSTGAAHVGLCCVFSFWISGLESSLSSFIHPLYYDMLLVKMIMFSVCIVLFFQQKLFLGHNMCHQEILLFRFFLMMQHSLKHYFFKSCLYLTSESSHLTTVSLFLSVCILLLFFVFFFLEH